MGSVFGELDEQVFDNRLYQRGFCTVLDILLFSVKKGPPRSEFTIGAGLKASLCQERVANS